MTEARFKHLSRLVTDPNLTKDQKIAAIDAMPQTPQTRWSDFLFPGRHDTAAPTVQVVAPTPGIDQKSTRASDIIFPGRHRVAGVESARMDARPVARPVERPITGPAPAVYQAGTAPIAVSAPQTAQPYVDAGPAATPLYFDQSAGNSTGSFNEFVDPNAPPPEPKPDDRLATAAGEPR